MARGRFHHQTKIAKKLSESASSYVAYCHSRLESEAAEWEAKLRRLAGRTGRDVRRWWSKIEKILEDKRRLEGEEVRRREMDKHGEVREGGVEGG